MKKLTASGHSVGALLAFLVVIGMAATSGAYVYNKNQTEEKETAKTSQPAPTEPATSGDPEATDRAGQTYQNNRFKLQLPAGWKFSSSEGRLENGENERHYFTSGDNFFDVNLTIGGRGVASDIAWGYIFNDNPPRTLSLSATPIELCDPAEAGAEGFCSRGDSRLDIFITLAAEQPTTTLRFSGVSEPVYLSFFAGNKTHEDPQNARLEDYKLLVENITFEL